MTLNSHSILRNEHAIQKLYYLASNIVLSYTLSFFYRYTGSESLRRCCKGIYVGMHSSSQ